LQAGGKYERDAAFAARHKLTEGADEIYVNGDSCFPGMRSSDPNLQKAHVCNGGE